MPIISKRALIASLATAILASGSLAEARTQISRPLALPHGVTARGMQLRSFANSTPRTTFVGGGATLPALAYSGTNALTQNPAAPSAGSILAYFATLTGVSTQYCQTGSGFGKRVFDGDTVKVTGGVNGPCAPLGTSAGSTNGFGAPAALALTDPDLTGSDAPLSQAEYTNFVNNKSATRGEAVELPSIIGSIAIVYNFPAPTPKLKLLDSQICALVEGKISNWSQLGQPAHPLTFVARSDGSGTTFAFSNHLLSVCGTSSGLNTSQQFAPVTGSTPPYVQPNPPSFFVGASGNPGVIAAVKAMPYSIGYVEAANAKAAVGGAIQYATVNGKDPILNLPETAAAYTYVSGTTVVTDSAVVTTGGAATIAPLMGVKSAGCVRLAVPSTYANITQGYPIIAVTNLLFSTTGNGSANATNLVKLVDELNTPSYFIPGKITTVNAPTTAKGSGTTGYAALGSSFNNALETIAGNCIKA